MGEHPEVLKGCRTESVRHTEKLHKEFEDRATANDISEWIDNGGY